MVFNIFTAKRVSDFGQYNRIDDFIALKLRRDERPILRQFLVNEFHFSAVCKCLDPRFVSHSRITSVEISVSRLYALLGQKSEFDGTDAPLRPTWCKGKVGLRGKTILFSVVIFMAAVAGGAQFFLGYWRALVGSMAAQPLSDKFFVAAGFQRAAMRADDFGQLLSLHRLMPDMKTLPNTVWRLRVHYSAVKMLRSLPTIGGWAQNEMATCTSCLAVLVDQRLLFNLACAAESRSY